MKALLTLFLLVSGVQKPLYFETRFDTPITIYPDRPEYLYWITTPKQSQLSAVAERQARDGLAIIKCGVRVTGKLHGCSAINVIGGSEFSKYAVNLARKFLMARDIAQRVSSKSGHVIIRIPMCTSVVCDIPEWNAG